MTGKNVSRGTSKDLRVQRAIEADARMREIAKKSVQKSLEQQAADNAELNPGTKRVEDMKGNVLWSLQ